MNHLTDQEIFREYAQRRSEAAFSILVRRHIDLVYSAALRMVRNPHVAEEVTQSVFVALAQAAPQLIEHPVLSGWLHRTTRNLAANALRSAARRQAREEEAAVMNQLLSDAPGNVWEEIAPHLDAALGELADADRDAVLLRYFERKSAEEMGRRLGISAEAAQKRVSRAVERLREIFQQRGVTISTAGLMTVVSANVVQAAPPALIGTVASIAASVTATAPIAATNMIAMTTLQKVLISSALTVAVGAGVYEARKAADLRNELRNVREQQAPLAAEMQNLLRERSELTNQLALLAQQNEQHQSGLRDLPRLRSEVTALRSQLAEALARDPSAFAGGTNANSLRWSIGQVIPKSNWRHAGYARPEDAFQTYWWAIAHTNADVFARSIVPHFHGDAVDSETAGRHLYAGELNLRLNQQDLLHLAGVSLKADDRAQIEWSLSRSDANNSQPANHDNETTNLRRINGEWKVEIDTDRRILTRDDFLNKTRYAVEFVTLYPSNHWKGFVTDTNLPPEVRLKLEEIRREQR